MIYNFRSVSSTLTFSQPLHLKIIPKSSNPGSTKRANTPSRPRSLDPPELPHFSIVLADCSSLKISSTYLGLRSIISASAWGRNTYRTYTSHDGDSKLRCVHLKYSAIKSFHGIYTLTIAQIGFINSDGEWAQHGVRYLISPEPEGSPYRFGKWIPLSTSDLSSEWGGSDIWVRGQGAAVAKAIWFHNHFNRDIEVSWSGMTEDEKQDLDVWLKERAERRSERRKINTEEYEARAAKYGARHHQVEGKMGMQAHYKSRMACRTDCGEKDPKFTCSKCKIARKSLSPFFLIVAILNKFFMQVIAARLVNQRIGK